MLSLPTGRANALYHVVDSIHHKTARQFYWRYFCVFQAISTATAFTIKMYVYVVIMFFIMTMA